MRSKPMLLLEAYELVGSVLDDYMDTIKAYDERELAANTKVDADKWADMTEGVNKRMLPLDDIRIALLKELVVELDNGMGFIAWVK